MGRGRFTLDRNLCKPVVYSCCINQWSRLKDDPCRIESSELSKSQSELTALKDCLTCALLPYAFRALLSPKKEVQDYWKKSANQQLTSVGHQLGGCTVA